MGSVFPRFSIQNSWHGDHGTRPTETISMITHDKYFFVLKCFSSIQLRYYSFSVAMNNSRYKIDI